MFEARLIQGNILKKIMHTIKDLVNEANFDCTSTGIAMQAMDSSHVALVALFMRAEGFKDYVAPRNISLGITLSSMAKVLKCAGNDDIITLRAEDNGDRLAFVFETPQQTRVSTFSLKLMDIDGDQLGIPDTDYKCIVKMSATEFERICRDMTIMGDTVKISATKEGIKFSVSGDLGNASVLCKQRNDDDEDDEDLKVAIKLEEEVSLTFALRYLNQFAKATPLSAHVILKMSPEVPLVVEYQIGDEMGFLRFYLAPKIQENGVEEE